MQLFYLICPKTQINDESFYSPLEEDFSKSPKRTGINFPYYKFGRRMKTRKNKNQNVLQKQENVNFI